jgi:hypothetical protein
MKYRETAKTAAAESAFSPNGPSNRDRMSDALTASLALVVIVSVICLLAELPAKLVLMAAMLPWGLLALSRIVALLTYTLEELLRLAGHPRDLNRDGQIGLPVHIIEEERKPWQH